MPNFEQFPTAENKENNEEKKDENKKSNGGRLRNLGKKIGYGLGIGVLSGAAGTALNSQEAMAAKLEAAVKNSDKSKIENMQNVSLEKEAMERSIKNEMKEKEVKFPTWKTVKLGRYGEKKQLKLIENIKSLGYANISGLVEHEIAGTKLTSREEERDVELVRLNPADVNLGEDATLREFYEKAEELGLKLIKNPAEVIGELALINPKDFNYDTEAANKHYLDQVVFAMKPINTNEGKWRNDNERDKNRVFNLRIKPEGETFSSGHRIDASMWLSGQGYDDLVQSYAAGDDGSYYMPDYLFQRSSK